MTKTANIVFLIDIQSGFARNDLTAEQGGSLYVPGGENVGEPAARLMRNLNNSMIVLSQDFHPADHISFAANHAGVAPFSNIYLRRDDEGHYRAIGAEIDGKVIAVDTDERGYITNVRSDELPASAIEGAVKQTLWLNHCIQGTESALFVDPIMGELPKDFSARVANHDPAPIMGAEDNRGNVYYVVRKGTKADLDSYGISTENDGISKTLAMDAFTSITLRLKERGITNANIYIGGLATNFCVEFSHADVHSELVPALKAYGIESQVHLLTDISAGIPIATPDGSWPDLDAAQNRMMSKGTKVCTTDDVIRDGIKSGTAPDPERPLFGKLVKE